jgi:hypothetical protein
MKVMVDLSLAHPHNGMTAIVQVIDDPFKAIPYEIKIIAYELRKICGNPIEPILYSPFEVPHEVSECANSAKHNFLNTLLDSCILADC